LRGEDRSVAVWGISVSVELQTAGPNSKFHCLGNGLPLFAPHCLMLVPVSTPL